MKEILLLEDDPALGEGIRMALQGGETAVTLVRTVKDARAALEEKPFDLGLWDVNLPDGDGISLTREIRAAGNRMPVILLTVHDLEMEIVAGLEPGARYLRLADRAEAIRTAVVLARPGDVILIAGKGHETYQIVGDVKHHFDDREEVRRDFASYIENKR